MSRVEPNDTPAAWEKSLRKQARLDATYADLEVQPIRWAVAEIDRLRRRVTDLELAVCCDWCADEWCRGDCSCHAPKAQP